MPTTSGPAAKRPRKADAPPPASLDLATLLKALQGLKRGDFTVELPATWTGIDGKIADAFNDIVELNRHTRSELDRLSRVVGKEGKLAQRATVGSGVGAWGETITAVNALIDDLVHPTTETARVIGAVAKGDLSQSMALDVDGRPLQGEFRRTALTVNTMVDQLGSFAVEVTRVAREVGTEGKLGGQAKVKGVAGTWKDLTDNVNLMASNLTSQVRNIATVTTAVANGDLSKKITVDVKGEILELKNTINTMVDQLNSFASEVTRVAREVGTEGKLGGQADVRGVSGTWKDLTDNVNFMAGNLTSQVRGIAKVVTAVANGDLERKLTLEAKGEIAELADTINNMTDTLATFADQVTSVAREVGVEGQLGGQALVPGAAGTWKDLTDNVNQLAANLTTQVRAIADVATAVTKGDLTRSIAVAAQGEVAALKDNINEMIRNLKDTTIKNNEQDWLKTNLAKFSRMLQGQKDMLAVGKLILSELAPVVSAQQGVFYVLEAGAGDEETQLRMLAGYALSDDHAVSYRLGQGLVGQCAVEGKKILLTDVPDGYVRISSGLGQAKPLNLMVLPVLFEGQVKGVMELSSFTPFSQTHELLLGQLTESIGIVLNTIEANTRTEDLLKQSQSLARELQSQQQELQKTNQQLEEKAGLLATQNSEVERKNQEVEQARSALEEKAKQLALTSKYKSEFLANMSHELRTPLNSLLILSDQLSRNPDGNLIPKQVEYAKTIHASGNDLLSLINDILDLSKIESGTVTVEPGDLYFSDLHDFVLRTFSHVAESRGLRFNVELDSALPKAMHTDVKRLQQVIKNLLSNAFKFTEHGSVTVRVAQAIGGWDRGNDSLNRAIGSVLSFSVVDTGIGIPQEKQQIIFEAFQQADGSTSRKYGGTGLGLAISREISHMLGGEIHLTSIPGGGSTFTLYLPRTYVAARVVKRPAVETRTDLVEPLQRELELPPDGSIIPNEMGDDRDAIEPGDFVLLIVDNDRAFTSYLMEVAREARMRVVATARGGTAIALVRQYRPAAILLDIKLADIEGWRVLRSVKNDFATRHIPVQVLSNDDDRDRALHEGAFGMLTKPIDRRQLDQLLTELRTFSQTARRRLLVVEDNQAQREHIIDLVGSPDTESVQVESGEAAIAAVADGSFDCVVLDLGLPDLAGIAVAERISQSAAGRFLPVIVFTGRDVPPDELPRLRRVAKTLIVKDGRSEEHLLEEVSLCLHRPYSGMDRQQSEMINRLHQPEDVLRHRRILVVDDDIRNIFAMTSLLERYEVEVVSAEDGKHAIEALEQDPGIELVLMDIMMPEMDGYDTMRAIRRSARFTSLPIIALTAKAMKGDREKCLDAGASDYVAKPIDPPHLIALLCVWLYRGAAVFARSH